MFAIRNFVLMLLLCPALYYGQPTRKSVSNDSNDSNMPLHLLRPEYRIPYEIPTEKSIKQILDRIWAYLDKETPTVVIDRMTNEEINQPIFEVEK